MARKTQTNDTAQGASSAAETAPAVHTPKRPKFVVVASKLPIHLTLQNCRPREARVTGQFGSTVETIMVKEGETVFIRGTGHPNGTVPKGFPKGPYINEAGFAITRNVPFDFWQTWIEQNKDTELVRNGLLMAEPDLDSLDDATADYAKVDSGLGPIDPDGDSRSPKPLMPLVSEITRDERMNERSAA